MCCRVAVERVYRELCARAEPPEWAFEAALTLYRHNHPEVPVAAAMREVRDWTGHPAQLLLH